MAEYGSRTYLRDANGPRVVSTTREQASRYGREESKSKRSHEKKSRSKHDSSRHKPTAYTIERPTLRLDIINQPTRSIALGMEVATSVLVSLAFSSPEMVRSTNLDSSRLVGVISVLSETRHGGLVAMETDTMVAQQLVDSLRPIPQEHADRFTRARPCQVPLGFMSFSDLLIRQAGQYRLRISLLQVPGAGLSPVSLTTADTDLVKVTRVNSHSRRHRVQSDARNSRDARDGRV